MITVAVEVVYRGIFQKTLARNIVRSIVFAAPEHAAEARRNITRGAQDVTEP